MIDKGHPLFLTRQARLLDLSRSSLYYEPVGTTKSDLALMAAIDVVHLKLPFYVARRLLDELRDRGFTVGRGHTSTLMRRMGMAALYPKRQLSVPHPGHKIYPYLLRGMEITRAGQVWAADVTLPAPGTRLLLSHSDHGLGQQKSAVLQLSNTLDASFAPRPSRRPWIATAPRRSSNTDQGLSVRLGGIYEPSCLARCEGQHGRPGPLDGQHLHRTAMEECEIRGGVPEGI